MDCVSGRPHFIGDRHAGRQKLEKEIRYDDSVGLLFSKIQFDALDTGISVERSCPFIQCEDLLSGIWTILSGAGPVFSQNLMVSYVSSIHRARSAFCRIQFI